jgi:hypothetical protein
MFGSGNPDRAIMPHDARNAFIEEFSSLLDRVCVIRTLDWKGEKRLRKRSNHYALKSETEAAAGWPLTKGVRGQE